MIKFLFFSLSSVAFLVLIGCNSPQVTSYPEDDDPVRRIIRERGIKKSHCYTQTSEQPRYLSAETTYNEHGDVSQMVFLTPQGDTQSIEKHTYDSKGRLTATQSGNSLSKLETVYKNEFNDSENKEIEYQYNLERGTVIRSVYTNDEQGRNQHKAYFVDDSLIATYNFKWDENEDMVLTEGFNANGKRLVELTSAYENHNCVATNVFREGVLVKSDSNGYDAAGNVLWTRTMVPNKYSDEIRLEYKDGLVVLSKSKFENLIPKREYVSEKQDEWEYH